MVADAGARALCAPRNSARVTRGDVWAAKRQLLREHAMPEEEVPKPTIYINNLNERINKEELKKSLYAAFSQFGPILDVVALKSFHMRGQAFIVFRDISSATQAVRQMQDFPFYDKAMHIAYAKTKSDATAKFDGTFDVVSDDTKAERAEKRKAEREARDSKAAKKAAAVAAGESEGAGKKAAAGAGPSGAGAPPSQPDAPVDVQGGAPTPGGGSSQPTEALPNPILFVENLPEQVNEMMLSMLFQQFPGYKEVRLVPGKAGIAFVEFEQDAQSSVAMTGLQNFKITPQNLMKISYAKR